MRNFLSAVLMLILSCGALFAQQGDVISTSVVTIDSKSYYVHTVTDGQTVYSIAQLYGATQNQVLADNPLAQAGIRAGDVLKISVPPTESTQDMTRAQRRRESRAFDTHTVNAGETAYAITKRYGISVNSLIEDNPGLDPAKLSLGQTLRIRKSAQGQIDEQQIKEQWQEYTQAINKVSDEYHYHLVKPGETVYSISRELGVPQNLIMRNNDIVDGLKAGTTIKLPLAGMPEYQAADKQVGLSPQEPLDPGVLESVAEIAGRGGREIYRVSMLLPLEVGGQKNRNYLDFYRGALLALESLKEEGVSVGLDLFNTDGSEEQIAEVVGSEAFEAADLIIGPVYEKNIAPIVAFAARRQIPVVSPLAALEGSYGPFVYQMSPAPGAKYDKMRGLFSSDNNVVVIDSESDDSDFAREIRGVLPPDHRRFSYTKGMNARSLDPIISRDKENVFIVLSRDEYSVDKILAMLSSIQTNLVSRSITTSPIRIVGTSRWTRFGNIDKDLYFKLRFCYISPYYAGRENESVAMFDSRYIKEFGSLPNQYSYRGYDAVKLFAQGLSKGGNLSMAVNSGSIKVLNMPYRFLRSSSHGGNYINDQWAAVCYNSDYTITLGE